MPKSNRYRVTYEQDETGTWVATIDGDHGVNAVTQGRSLSVARKRIRDALAVFLDDGVAAQRAELVDNVKLPAPLSGYVSETIATRREPELASQRALTVTERTARKLAKAGVSRRDTAEILGVSYQRIQQLVGEG